MVTVVHLGDFGKGPHGGHHGHGGHGGRWGRGGWGGGWPGYYDYGPVYYEAPENRYVIIDPNGRAVAVVKGIPRVPAGYSFRLATVSEMATGLPTSFAMSGFGFHSPTMQRHAAGAPQASSIYGLGQVRSTTKVVGTSTITSKSIPGTTTMMKGFGDYAVTGPEGQLYGRYKTYPTPAQIPLYAMVTQEGMSGVF